MTAWPAEPPAVGDVGAVVVAAGRSLRLGRDKLLVELIGRPVLAWALAAFEECPAIGSVSLVLSGDNREMAEVIVRSEGFRKVRRICQGGPRRQDSVLAGLRALGRVRIVAVHDGARPLVTPTLIERGIAAAQETGAAIPGVPVKDTVKIMGPGQRVAATPARASLRAIQTPQVFDYDLLLAAYESSTGEVTDDAALLEGLGRQVVVYPGDPDNLKITTADDLVVAEALLRRRLASGGRLP